MKTLLFTLAALAGFAANSLLTRSALASGSIDAASFTMIRLAAGAVALVLIASAQRRPIGGSWISAIALGGYAIAFTLAYQRIGAGIGALALFGAVQATMIGRGLLEGERPGIADTCGWLLAIGGLAVLTLRGAAAPDLIGLLLMAIAGACWGVYSLRGRGARDPVAATAGNFLRATIFGAIFLAASWTSTSITSRGATIAAVSGAVTSGLGYVLWYSALPHLSAWRAAVIQLSVPVLTALAAALLLHEPPTRRLVMSSALIASGVILAVSRTAVRRGPTAR